MRIGKVTVRKPGLEGGPADLAISQIGDDVSFVFSNEIAGMVVE